MHKIFSNFDYHLPALDGFVDDSWGNDTSPSMWCEELQLKLFCDYKDPTKREFEGGKIFALYKSIDGELSIPLFESDHINEVKSFIKKYKANHDSTPEACALALLRSLGLPEPHISQNAEGGRVFAFTWQDISIYDPYTSSCGRGAASPTVYGLTPQQAQAIDHLNKIFNFDSDI